MGNLPSGKYNGGIEKKMCKSKYFNAGRVVATCGINEAMKNSNRFALEVEMSLRRYLAKDWGDLTEEDKQVNEDALQFPDDIYLLGVYETCRGRIYIITNRISEKAGDNITTVCFPDER